MSELSALRLHAETAVDDGHRSDPIINRSLDGQRGGLARLTILCTTVANCRGSVPLLYGNP